MKLSTGNLLPLCILQTKTLSQTSLCDCRENPHNNTLNTIKNGVITVWVWLTKCENHHFYHE
jgi:hypothetical protein